MTFGLPYCGSKNRIASWVVDNINPQDNLFSTFKDYRVFVDPFFGGGAISHYILQHRKFELLIGNDLTTTALLFERLLKGEIDLGKYTHITREEFLKNKALPPSEQDQIIALVYSFGNNRQDYLYTVGNEKLVETRRGLDGSFYNPLLAEHLQRLNRLNEIGKIRTKTQFEARCMDYRELEIPKGSLVYLDPPYKDSCCTAYYDSKRISTFNYEEMYRWAEDLVLDRDCDVYMSERVAPKYYEEVRCKDFALNYREAGGERVASVEKIFRIIPREMVRDVNLGERS